jgi:hypothetical protein
VTTLADLDHFIGADLAPSGSGDLQAATGTLRGQQRVLRRLLTNPGDYIFHPEYGAGLPRYVGETADVPKIKALVQGQMLLEDAVARSPAPVVTVSPIASADGGGFAISIRYVDAPSGQPVTLSFNVGG